MRAVTYHYPSDNFQYVDIAVPVVSRPFDVLVKVIAVGLNPVDAKINHWMPLMGKTNEAVVVGLDISGIIVGKGLGVTNWNIGDRVLYHGNRLAPSGGLAEYALQDSRAMVIHPPIAPIFAASTPCAAWTAYRALFDKLEITERSSIFIAGGSGGVGSFAIQMAKHARVKTIITSCSNKNHEFVRRLGATHVVDYSDGAIGSKVHSITNQKGVEVALDCVGGDSYAHTASTLMYEGEMVGLVGLMNPTKYPDSALKGLSFHHLSLGAGYQQGDKGRASLCRVGRSVSMLLEKGQLRVPVLTQYTLEQAPYALKQIRKQRTIGKRVVVL